jgi:hypothetical protein
MPCECCFPSPPNSSSYEIDFQLSRNSSARLQLPRWGGSLIDANFAPRYESKNTSDQDLAFREFRPSPAKNWDEQLLYQRGIEAVIWGMPAVSMAFCRNGAFEAYGITYQRYHCLFASRPANMIPDL